MIFVFFVIVLGYFSFYVFKSFFLPVAWAIVLAMLFYPIYLFFLRYVKWKPLASISTLIIILIIILGPFSYLTYVLVQEMQALSETIGSAGPIDPYKSVISHPYGSKILAKVLSTFGMTEPELHQMVTQNISKLGKELLGGVTTGFGNVLSFGVNFVLMVLSLFFLLEDGPRFLNWISKFLPFSPEQRTKLINQTRDIVISTMYGGIVVGIVQALIGGVTFYFLSIPSPVLWGMSMFITSFIPVVGTFLIWGPAIVYLLIKGLLLKAIILGLVGFFLISMADNIIRPIIVRGKTEMPTIIILFSILGGIQYFGFIGFILGPLVIALFISVIEIFQLMSEERSKKAESLND